jgi:hypothetical protein
LQLKISRDKKPDKHKQPRSKKQFWSERHKKTLDKPSITNPKNLPSHKITTNKKEKLKRRQRKI